MKPLDMLELSARVKSMLRLKSLHDELGSRYRGVARVLRDHDEQP